MRSVFWMRLLNKGRTVLAAAVLAALTLAVYAPVGRHQFLDYDDVHYILENEPVRQGLSAAGARWAFTTFYASNWHPLTWLSHQADVQLFGLDAGWHHLTNLAFHTANVLLLLAVLLALSGAFWPSLLVAALFAVHPLHVETVAWAAERKDVLSTFFWALALLAWIRYLRRPGAARYLMAAFLFALGLMAKPMVVTFPLLLLLLDAWPLGRFRRPALREKLPLLALSAASGVMTVLAQSRNETLPDLAAYSLEARLANAAVSCAAYLRDVIRPTRLAVFYPFPAGGPSWRQAAGALLLLAAICAVSLPLRRRRPWLAMGWFWFLIALLPVIGLLQVGYQARADRYTYVPLTGLFIALAWELADRSRGWRPGRAVLGAVGVLAVAVCVRLTMIQVGYWHDGVALFEHALKVAPDNWQSRYNLGHAYYDQGRTEEARTQFRASLAMNPDFENANNNLGLILAKEGRFAEAITLFRRAIRENPRYREAWFNLGLSSLGIGDRRAAGDAYRALLEMDPEWGERLRRFIDYPMGR